jgi:hypothetical protein
MKISEYIAELQAIAAEHGDLDVEVNDWRNARVLADSPGIAYRKILQGRETKPGFWHSGIPTARKGAKVCRL